MKWTNKLRCVVLTKLLKTISDYNNNEDINKTKSKQANNVFVSWIHSKKRERYETTHAEK